MQAQTKKTILITLAAIAAALLLAAVGWFVYFNSQFGSYNDAQHHFAVKYPSAWKFIKSPQASVAVVFQSPKENALDILQENVNITVQAVPPHLASLQSFSDKIYQQMTVVFKQNIKVVENVAVNFGGRQGRRMVFEAPKPDNLKMVVVWTIKGDQAYIFTYLGLIKTYPQYGPLVEEMVKSFKLK